MAEGDAEARRRLRAGFSRAARTYDAAAVLERKVGDQLIERLDVVKLVPKAILDVGCGTGYCTRLLAKRYRRAQVIGVDLAHTMTARARHAAGWFSRSRFVNAAAEQLPFADASFDMLVSNLMLHWSDPSTVFAELSRLVRPGGLLVFTSYGPDTLQELRQARGFDQTSSRAAFIDMHDIGDSLVRAGFADPVMDVERYVLTYPNVRAILRDLKARGDQGAYTGNIARGLGGRAHLERFESAYQAMSQDGRLPVTYEVVYGHAWAPSVRRMSDGAVRIPIEKIGRRR